MVAGSRPVACFVGFKIGQGDSKNRAFRVARGAVDEAEAALGDDRVHSLIACKQVPAVGRQDDVVRKAERRGPGRRDQSGVAERIANNASVAATRPKRVNVWIVRRNPTDERIESADEGELLIISDRNPLRVVQIKVVVGWAKRQREFFDLPLSLVCVGLDDTEAASVQIFAF